MKVLEQYLWSKTANPNDCEDGIFVNESFAVVVDGATSKSGTLWDGKKSGQVARDLILNKCSELSGDIDAQSAFLQLDSAITDWYVEHGVLEMMSQNPVERPSASVVVYSKKHAEIWMVGDCQVIIDGRLVSNEKKIDQVTADARAAFIEAEILAGASVTDLLAHDTGRDFIQPLLERQNRFQNRVDAGQFGYETIDGFFAQYPRIRVVPATGAQELVLASDGYPVLTRTLLESEELLASILADDPLLYKKFRSTKGLVKHNTSYDDRAYLKLGF
jgi:hypothetical protein